MDAYDDPYSELDVACDVIFFDTLFLQTLSMLNPMCAIDAPLANAGMLSDVATWS